MTPVTASPNKNLGPEKIILLVCNRACTGHQGKRYYDTFCSVMKPHLLYFLRWCNTFSFVMFLSINTIDVLGVILTQFVVPINGNGTGSVGVVIKPTREIDNC